MFEFLAQHPLITHYIAFVLGILTAALLMAYRRMDDPYDK